MSEFADHLLTTSEARRLRLDLETGLPMELGPFEIMGNGTNWSVIGWPDQVQNVHLEGFTTLWDAFAAMFDAYRKWHTSLPNPVVYFIGTELRRGCDVKVGFTRNLDARLKALQTASPTRLQVFATVAGGPELEEKYHRRWRTRRRGGEWFTIGDCIIAEIERLRAL